MNLRKFTRLGSAIGLAFVTCFHTGLDFLTPILIWPAYPCWWVAMKSSALLALPEGIAWGLGVLALTLLGAAVLMPSATSTNRLGRQRQATSGW